MLVATHLKSNMCTKDIEFHLAINTLDPQDDQSYQVCLEFGHKLGKEKKKVKVMLFGLAIKLATVSFKPNPHLACQITKFLSNSMMPLVVR